jgi:hypothetical protein
LRDARVDRGRVEAVLEGNAGALSLSHGVIDFENYALGAVRAMRFFLPALHNRESVDHVTGRFSVDIEKTQKSRIQFAPEQKGPVIVPAERFAVDTSVAREPVQVIHGLRHFHDTRYDPLQQRRAPIPAYRFVEHGGRRNRQLFDDEHVEVFAAYFPLADVIEWERTGVAEKRTLVSYICIWQTADDRVPEPRFLNSGPHACASIRCARCAYTSKYLILSDHTPERILNHLCG